MEASKLYDLSGRTGSKNKKITVDPILGGDHAVVRVSSSDDGNAICFTDYYGKRVSVKLPANGSVRGEINHDAPLGDNNPGCGCIYDHFCGMAVLVDPNTGQLCNHY